MPANPPPPLDEWTSNELEELNISIVPTEPEDFFLPDQIDFSLEDHFDPLLLTATSPSDAFTGADNISWTTLHYLANLYLASTSSERLIEFEMETLRLCGFEIDGQSVITSGFLDNDSTIACENYKVPSGGFGVCIENPNRISGSGAAIMMLFVMEENRKSLDVEAEMIALAISSIDRICSTRFYNKKALTCPCIIMSGTRPTFYLVPVSDLLMDGYLRRKCADETRVLKCTTVLNDSDSASGAQAQAGAEVGMENVEYRQLALRRFLAFRAVAQHHWKVILDCNEGKSKENVDDNDRFWED